MEYANALINAGNQSEVSSYLWTGSSSYNGGAIKFDLDWIAKNFVGSNFKNLYNIILNLYIKKKYKLI